MDVMQELAPFVKWTSASKLIGWESSCTTMHVCRAEEEGLADEGAFAREYGDEMGFDSIQEDELGRIRAVVSTASTQLSLTMLAQKWLTATGLVIKQEERA